MGTLLYVGLPPWKSEQHPSYPTEPFHPSHPKHDSQNSLIWLLIFKALPLISEDLSQPLPTQVISGENLFRKFVQKWVLFSCHTKGTDNLPRLLGCSLIFSTVCISVWEIDLVQCNSLLTILRTLMRLELIYHLQMACCESIKLSQEITIQLGYY